MHDIAAKADALMDGLRDDLVRLAAIPSVAFPGFPAEPVREAHDLLVGLLRGAGVDHAASAVVPYARAKLNLRFHPLQDPHEVRARLVDHLNSLTPFGVSLTVTPGDTGPGYEAATGAPAYRAALAALQEAWGAEPSYVATGGSIPLVNGVARAAPDAEVLLFGAQDSMCNLHAPNERVLFSELRNTVVAMCAFVERYAADFRSRSQGGAAAV
ncbi:hypothetical protein [Streptomyces sp. NPDC101455]|uniref:hypothetical protein n=1 Tax=Streptomyces sp. NPDC101455 TaxID=3366142 RepID=UPI0037F47FE3